MKRRKSHIVTIVIPASENSQEIVFDISLSKLEILLKDALDNEEKVINFKVGSQNINLKIENAKQIIKMTKRQLNSQIIIPSMLKNYLSILSNNNEQKLSARDEEIEKLWSCLCSVQKNNAILVGEHGVGKTTMVMEVVRQISLGECPKQLIFCKILSINTSKLLELAERSIFKFEKVLNALVKFAKDNRNNAIFYIDNLLHVKCNQTLMKCFIIFIKTYNIRFIASISIDDFEKYFTVDAVSMKYINPILLEEPDVEEIYPILKKRILNLQKTYKVKISEKMIRFAILTGLSLSSSSSANPESTLDIINFALADAARRAQKEVIKSNILSYYYIDFKLAKKTNEEEKWITAYHEAGHYLVSKMSLNIKNSKNAFVSILPIKGALGLTVSYTDFGKQLTFSKEYYIDEIAFALGGRVGEAIYTNEFSSGAQADIESANTMAESLVLSLGLSSIDGEQNKSYMVGNYIKDFLLTDELRVKINNEISSIINEAYERAEKIINEKRELLDEIAKKLVNEGVLMGDELEEIYNKYKNSKIS